MIAICCGRCDAPLEDTDAERCPECGSWLDEVGAYEDPVLMDAEDFNAEAEMLTAREVEQEQ